MKHFNTRFTGMSHVTPTTAHDSIKDYYPNSSKSEGAKRLVALKKVGTLSDLIDFCIEDYRAWGDSILLGAGAFLKINDFPNEINDAKKYVKMQVENYLNGKPFSESEYDAWHKVICLNLSNPTKHFASYSTYRKASSDKFKNKSGFTVGNSQKFLNMLMKDLYACLKSNSTLLPNYEDYFKYCHMPLDSYILRFVDDIRERRNISTPTREYTWSNLNAYESYMKEQQDIRDYVRNNKIANTITELQTEFVVWPLYKPVNNKSVSTKSSKPSPNSNKKSGGVKMLNEFTTEYIIPFGQKKISENEFSRCADLECLYIPYYVEEIPDSNFFDRSGVFKRALQKPWFKICGEKGTPAEAYANAAGILFEETTMWIQNNTLKAYFGQSDKVVIPNDIERIRYGAFQYAPHVVDVVIPNSVNVIDSEAFTRCAIKEITIPKSVTGMGSRAFMDCKELMSVTFENANTVLDNDCFKGCHKDLTIKAPAGGTVQEYTTKYQIRFQAI